MTDARASAQRAHAIAEEIGDLPLQVMANFYLGLTCHRAGDYRGADDFFRKVIQSLEGDLSRERFGLAGLPAVLSSAFLAWVLTERGEFEDGIALGQQGARIAEAVNHPYSLIQAYLNLAHLYGVKGDFSHAVPLLERALALSRDWNVTFTLPRITALSGYVNAQMGRVAVGLPLLQQAVKATEARGEARFHSLFLLQLGEACLLADRFDDAIAYAGRALSLTRDRGERGWEAYALRLLGEIDSHRDPPNIEQAEASYREALALADELGMRPLVAHCHLGLGKLYLRSGKREQAREHLSTAAAMFREMDMGFWLAKAEAELAKAE